MLPGPRGSGSLIGGTAIAASMRREAFEALGMVAASGGVQDAQEGCGLADIKEIERPLGQQRPASVGPARGLRLRAPTVAATIGILAVVGVSGMIALREQPFRKPEVVAVVDAGCRLSCRNFRNQVRSRDGDDRRRQDHPCPEGGRRGAGERRHRHPRSFGHRPGSEGRPYSGQGVDRRRRKRTAADPRRRRPAGVRRLCTAMVGRARRARGDRARRAWRFPDGHAGGARQIAGGGDAGVCFPGQQHRPLDAGGPSARARDRHAGGVGAVRLSERQPRPQHADGGRAAVPRT